MTYTFIAEIPDWLIPGRRVVWVRPKWEDSSKQVRTPATVEYIAISHAITEGKDESTTITPDRVWLRLDNDDIFWVAYSEVANKLEPEPLP